MEALTNKTTDIFSSVCHLLHCLAAKRCKLLLLRIVTSSYLLALTLQLGDSRLMPPANLQTIKFVKNRITSYGMLHPGTDGSLEKKFQLLSESGHASWK
jgi:hypothetical protein